MDFEKYNYRFRKSYPKGGRLINLLGFQGEE